MNTKNYYLYLWGIIPLIFAPFFTNQFLPKAAYASIVACIFLVILCQSQKTIYFSIISLLWLLLLSLQIIGAEFSLPKYSYYILLFFTHLIFCNFEKTPLQVFKAFTLSATAVSLWGITQYYLGTQVGWPEYTASFSNINAAATFISAISLYTLAIALYQFNENKFISYWYIVSFAIQIYYLIITQNRASWLAFFVASIILLAMVVCFLWKQNKKHATLLSAVFIVGYICIFVFFSFNTELQKRFESIFDTEHPSNKIRILMWDSTIKMAQQNTWVGIGTGNFSATFPEYRNPIEYQLSSGRTASHPHNTFLFLCAENGILSLLLFCAIIIATILYLLKPPKKETMLFIPVLISITINMLFFFVLLAPATGIIFAMITGIASPRKYKLQRNILLTLILSLVIITTAIVNNCKAIADIFFHSAQQDMISEKFDSAIHKFEWANSFHQNKIIDYESGRCYLAQQKYNLASIYFEKSLQSNHLENAYINLGITYIRQSKHEDALILWRKASKIYPYSVPINYSLAKLLLEMGFSKEARSLLYKTLVLSPKIEQDVDYLMNLGLTYEYEKRYRDALNYYIKAKDLENKNMLPTIYMAQIFIKLGLHSAALHHLENVANNGNSSEAITANLLMAEIYENIQEPNVAMTFYFKVIQQNKQNYQANYALARILFFDKKYDMAFKFFQQALSISSETPWPYIFISLIYLEKNEIEKGKLYLIKAQEKGFSMWNDLLNLEVSEKTIEIIKQQIK